MAEAKKSKKKSMAEKPEKTIKADEKLTAQEKPGEEAKAIASTEKSVAKAGKRSAKSRKEAEEKQAKETRKEAAEPAKPKTPSKPPRTRLERAGKKYREAAKQLEIGKAYTLPEACELATKTSPVKFDATVEIHIKLNVDPKQADQNVRGMVVLPGGSAKKLRIAVFADAPEAAKAKSAGADIAGVEELTALFDKNQLAFDVLIAPPALMPQLGKYAKLLGPRGLMPSHKSGTVSADVVAAVTEAKSGRVEFRVDQAGIIHLPVGKVSFGPQKLQQNAEAVMSAVQSAKPASIKGIFIGSVHIATTMGPSIKVAV